MRINVSGAIVPNDDAWIYDWLGMDCCSPGKVAESLTQAAGQDVDVYINSGGGNIFAGSEIYEALRQYTGKLRLHIVGLAGSAASVIACAGWCDMAPTAMMMVHNVSVDGVGGDYHEMDRAGEMLRKANGAIAAAYIAKTGMAEADALALMDKETWMTAQDALDKKLVDAIAAPAKAAVKMAAAADACLLPEKTMERIRNTVKPPAAQKLAARVKILELKGVPKNET